MAKAATTELQQQIEEVRREAYAAGYAAAMQVIADGASRPAPKAGTTAAAPRRRGRGRVRQAATAAKPIRPRRARATATTTRRSANGRAQRGTNARIIEEILKAVPGATCGDPESTTGQRRRDILCLDPPRAAPTGSAQRRRAGWRQQDLASPRRHSLKRTSVARRGSVRCSCRCELPAATPPCAQCRT